MNIFWSAHLSSSTKKLDAANFIDSTSLYIDRSLQNINKNF